MTPPTPTPPTHRDILRWRPHPTTTPPPLLQYRASTPFILLTITTAIFTDIFLYAVIVPVVPFALTSRAHTPPASVQYWTSVLLAVYGACLLAASPVCGWVADRTGSRRGPLLVGLGALGGATLLLCFGRGVGVLVVGRVLQGFSAAVVWTVGLALLVDTVGRGRVGECMGYVALAMSLAVLVAPVLGGVVFARAGWFAVFGMAGGLVGVDVVMRCLLVEKGVARRWEGVAGTGGEGGEKEGEEAVAEESAIVPSNGRSVKGRNSFVLLLSSRRLLAALYCTLAQSILLTAWDAVLPLYVNRIWGWSSIGAGLIFFPLILPSFLSPLFGYWSDKKGPRIPTALGFLLAVPFLVLLRFVNHDSLRQKVLLCALLAFLGFALSMAMTPLLAEITYVVGDKEQSHPGAFGGKGAYATAYGLFNMAFAGGMLVGPIWGGFVTQSKGWGAMCWSLAILSISGAVVAELWVGGWVGKSGKEAREKKVEVRNSGRGEV